MLESSVSIMSEDVKEEIREEIIEESFEEILCGYKVEEELEVEVETEPLCGSCFAALDCDEDQTIGYCEKCQTMVFVERRMCHSSLDSEM